MCGDSGLRRRLVNLEQALLVERHHAEWFVAESMVPGAEVHRDRDVTWVVHSGHAWRNAGIMVRFSAASAERRLDTLLVRYQQHGRGMALWISPSATPESSGVASGSPAALSEVLSRHASNTRRRRSAPSRARALEIRPVVDVAEYESTPHPAIGPITTPLRRQAFERLRALVADRFGANARVRGVAEGEARRCDRAVPRVRERRPSQPDGARRISGQWHRIGVDRARLRGCRPKRCEDHGAAGLRGGTTPLRTAWIQGGRSLRLLVSELSTRRLKETSPMRASELRAQPYHLSHAVPAERGISSRYPGTGRDCARSAFTRAASVRGSNGLSR